jgi:phosphoesterase RecJ-like protein
MDQIITRLAASNHVLIASHTDPDGDAIGSLLAAGLSMKALKKRRGETAFAPTLYNESAIPAVYRFLPKVETITSRLDASACFDTAVVLDCSDLDRLGAGVLPFIEATPVVLNIDHHPTNTGFGDFQLIQPEACATAEIIYRLISRMETPIDADIATALYTGIFTDTGSFRFANTNQAAFSICNQMVACGADPYKVAKHVYGTYSLGRIKLLNRALDSIEISENGRLSMMTLTQEMFDETGTQSEDVDGLINYARRIRNIKVAVLIHEHPNGNGDRRNGVSQFHVSLRSDGAVDVSRIAALFGGGGHRTAAGFTVHTDVSDIKNGMMELANGL